MADAPKNEATSSSWGAFEIGIAVLIIVALLSRNTVSENTKTSEVQTADLAIDTTEDYTCGLQVTSPARNAEVGSTFTLRGVTEGCYWDIKEGVVLSYQVIDAQGTPVSDFKIVRQTFDVFPYIFEENVVFTTTPKTKSGFIVLLAPHPTTDNQTVSVRIPIRFKK
jgi:hypothetical protein